MTHPFEVKREITIEATPEQVWEAISTGPGLDAWFMGHSEIEPGEGGTNRMTMEGFTSEATISAWEPQQHLAYSTAPAEDGTFMAFEYLVEGRDGGSTVIRFVHSGVLGDDWESEWDALQVGDFMYLQKLAQYAESFAGRTAAHNVFGVGSTPVEKAKAWAAFGSALGVDGAPAEGDKVRLEIDGIPPVDGVVGIVNGDHYAIVRSEDALHLFAHGHGDMVWTEHHYYTDIDGAASDQAWQRWLAGVVG